MPQFDPNKLRSLPREVREVIEGLSNQLDLVSDTLIGPGAGSSQDFPGGDAYNADTTDLTPIDVQLTSFGTNADSGLTAYEWIEQEPIAGGLWQVKTDGLTGSVDVNPAYERNEVDVTGSLPIYTRLNRGYLNPSGGSDLEWIFDFKTGGTVLRPLYPRRIVDEGVEIDDNVIRRVFSPPANVVHPTFVQRRIEDAVIEVDDSPIRRSYTPITKQSFYPRRIVDEGIEVDDVVVRRSFISASAYLQESNVINNGTTTVSPSTQIVVPFPTVVLDFNSEWNTSTNTFTAANSYGLMIFAFSIVLATPSGSDQLGHFYLYINGSFSGDQVVALVPAGGSILVNGYFPYPISKGDTMKLEFANGDPSSNMFLSDNAQGLYWFQALNG